MGFNSAFKELRVLVAPGAGQDVLEKIKMCFQLVETTNKMQLCNGIYFSKIYWRLNMFRATYRSSSGALNCICSLWFIYPCGDRLLSRLGGRGCTYSLDLLMISGIPLETCSAFNKFWNNKFYYKVASCWLFLLIHTAMHGAINIKFMFSMSVMEPAPV
jgi:hypothetical protein